MSWVYLLIAGILEIGWPFGLKMSQTVESNKFLWILLAIISMAGSGAFLWMAQKTIPMGTAYAIWTGLGAVGAFTIGIIYFNDSASMFRIISVTLLILGIIGLKLSN